MANKLRLTSLTISSCARSQMREGREEAESTTERKGNKQLPSGKFWAEAEAGLKKGGAPRSKTPVGCCFSFPTCSDLLCRLTSSCCLVNSAHIASRRSLLFPLFNFCLPNAEHHEHPRSQYRRTPRPAECLLPGQGELHPQGYRTITILIGELSPEQASQVQPR